MILYGDGTDPPGTLWDTDRAATKDNLENALTAGPLANGTWLMDKLEDQDGDSAQLFFWAGDHGGVDTPISFSVDAVATGQAGTAIKDRKDNAKPTQNVVYEGGGKNPPTNVVGWEYTPLPVKDINAIATGYEDIQIECIWVRNQLLFSVDMFSLGLAGTGVRQENQLGGAPESDVFAATRPVGAAAAGGNRRMIDGQTTLGLTQVPIKGGG